MARMLSDYGRAVFVIGLTGGIGCGKSAVAERLVEHGAVLIDADAIAREVVEPGTEGLTAIEERFGAAVIRADGTLDRAALASIVFADAAARKDLEAITHPAIGARIAERFAELASTDTTVVLDVPLMVESGRGSYDVLVVVDADPDLAVERARLYRGLDPDDVRRRQAVQAAREERLAKADYVINNDGSLADLDIAVAALWTQIEARRLAKEMGSESSDG